MRLAKYTVFFLFITMIMASYSCVFADVKLFVSSPKDKTITLNYRLKITGNVSGDKAIMVNGIKLKTDSNGDFNAVALLWPGKNLIEINTVGAASAVNYKARLIRNISYDDMEEYSSGKPHWARSPVVFLSTLGVIEGYPDNTFLPDKAVSRGEIATWLAKAKGLKLSKLENDIFYDVPKEHWRAPYIKAVIDAGYMVGVTHDKFGIDQTMKRREVVDVFIKAYGFKPNPGRSKLPFLDVPKESDSYQNILAGYSNGMVIGFPGNKKLFAPDLDMRRSDTAIMISSLPNIRAKRLELYDFGRGFGKARYSKIGTKPEIVYVKAEPKSLNADGRSNLTITTSIKDEQGLQDISQVWADISSFNGPNNAKMSTLEAGVWQLIFTVSIDAIAGERTVIVKALDKTGLESEARTKVVVNKKGSSK